MKNNQDDIDLLLQKTVMLSRKHPIVAKDPDSDLFCLKNIYSKYYTLGEITTPYKCLSTKQLLENFFSLNSQNSDSHNMRDYLQEFHNRLAKAQKFPATSIQFFEFSRFSNNSSNGKALTVRSVEQIIDTENRYPNNEILVANSPISILTLLNMDMYLDPLTAKYIEVIAHESRHARQYYITHLLFSNMSQISKENTLNVLGYYNVLKNCAKTYCQLHKQPLDIYPALKCKSSEQTLKARREYLLNPVEIDARKSAFETMETLFNKGYLNKTTWKNYRYKHIFVDYQILNLFGNNASDICPAINYVKKLYKNLDRFYATTPAPQFHDYLKPIKNKLNLDKYFEELQRYYESLKLELSKAIIETANGIKNNTIDPVDKKIANKLIYAYDQSLNNNGQVLSFAVVNAYNDYMINELFNQKTATPKELYQRKKRNEQQRKFLEMLMSSDK